MDERRRLRLIVKAVKYCRGVRDLGMPANCYTKALREPIFFLWETRGHPKEKAARFRSEAANGLHFGSGRLRYDHAIPFRLIQDKLLAVEAPDEQSVRTILNRFSTAVLITAEEDAVLTRAGLRDKMPPDWDGRDPLARYKAVGIRLVGNTSVGDERGVRPRSPRPPNRRRARR